MRGFFHSETVELQIFFYIKILVYFKYLFVKKDNFKTYCNAGLLKVIVQFDFNAFIVVLITAR